jgi:hypothetical protein
MHRDELFIYGLQFIALLVLVFYAEYRFQFTRLGLRSACLLFLSSVCLAAFSAYLAEFDSRKYLRDAVLLMSFLEKDPRMYGLFFLTGGNSLYPESYFPMLIASNTWSNYTSYTIEKFYLFFSLISKPNLYNVSLFFGALSFVSKSLLIRSFQLFDQDSFKLKLIYAFLLIGGLEVFFVSGVYKENLLFFFLSFIVYAYYSRPRVWKYIIAFLCLLNAVFLRLDTMIIIVLILSVLFLFFKYRQWGFWRYPLIILSSILSLFCLYYLDYKDYVIGKLNRYANLKQGNTHFDPIDWNKDAINLCGQILLRWRQAFYSIYTTTDYLYIVSLVNGLSVIFIGILLYYQSIKWYKLTLVAVIVFVAFMLTLSLFIPNYAALLRYRSPLFVLMIFGLILNIRKKTI